MKPTYFPRKVYYHPLDLETKNMALMVLLEATVKLQKRETKTWRSWYTQTVTRIGVT